MIDFNKVQAGDFVKQIHGPRDKDSYNLPDPITHYEIVGIHVLQGVKYFVTVAHRLKSGRTHEIVIIDCFSLVNDYDYVRTPWTNWKSFGFQYSGDTVVGQYKTNYRYIKFKALGITVKSSCHKEDTFNLTKGLEQCVEKWKQKRETQKTIKKEPFTVTKVTDIKITPIANCPTIKKRKNGAKDITDIGFGDFMARKIVGKDSSGHNLWLCECIHCGKTITGTVYDLAHGRIKTKCTNCQNTRGKIIPALKSPTANTKPNEDFIAPLMNDSNNNNNNNNNDNGNTSQPDVNEYKVNVTVEENRVLMVEKQTELTEMPVYFSIAHCIPNNLAFIGETAKKIDSLWDMKNKIVNQYDSESFSVGEVIPVENVFNLILTYPYHKANMEAMDTCLINLAKYCKNYGIKYLAMPKIGCGKNGLDWDVVSKKIEDSFNRVLTGDQFINIVVCYK